MSHQLTISCRKDHLVRIREFVGTALSQYSVSDIDRHKIILAVDEVCANLIIHGNHCNEKESIDISVEVSATKMVTFTISHTGSGFDINTYNEPSMQELISSKRKGGLGLMLVKRIMDKIEFTTEKNHNICRLVKQL